MEFEPACFDAVVALHSIIHVPREQQASLLGRILTWLRPGGGFLATWAIDEWEGQEADWEGWGAPMWWSHFGADDNLAMLIAAGFTIDPPTGSRKTARRGCGCWRTNRPSDPRHTKAWVSSRAMRGSFLVR